ncbi:hypothetical protein CH289_07895 [Rhodococcus sp. RS1C4]|nr:hypothetical protein [Rhodococcus sp. RS1C4]OZC55104.1 hypothetical protein CH289_07895 [Rhodococcus sp. RS1C4]
MSIRDDLAGIIECHDANPVAAAQEILERYVVLEYREPDRQDNDGTAVFGTHDHHATGWTRDGVIRGQGVYANIRHGDDPTAHCAAIMSAHRHALNTTRK